MRREYPSKSKPNCGEQLTLNRTNEGRLLPCGYAGDALPGIAKAVDLSKHVESSAIAVEQGATEQFRRARRPEASFHGRRLALVARKGEHILNAQRFTCVLDLVIDAILINSAF